MNSYHKLSDALVVAFAFLLLVPASIYAQTSPAFGGTVTQNANLRSGPGTTYAKTGSATGGQAVQVIACNDGCTWYKLDSGSWIFAELVQVRSTATTAADTSTPAPASGGKATAVGAANLRSGPGTSYERVGSVSAGQALTLAGRNEAGDWYQLADGTWIAAFLVKGAPDNPAIASAAAETRAPDVSPSPAEQVPPAQPAGSPNITIRTVNYDGVVYRVESDEYVEVTNTGSAPANLSGWVINAGDPGQNFSFPSYELAPGQSCRVYTNENHPDSGGFSFGRGQAIWNNKGDCGYLYDSSGNQVDSYCY